MPRKFPNGMLKTMKPVYASFKRTALWMLCAFASLIQAWSAPSEPQFLRITAEIDLITYSNSFTAAPGIESMRTFPLTCIVGAKEWRIDEEFVSHSMRTWCFDGTNVYERTQLKDSWTASTSVGGMPLTSKLLAQARSNVTVTISPSQDGHPLGHLGVNIAWLAFCSGSYLKQPGCDLPMPADEIRVDPLAFAYADSVQVFDDPLGLPKTVELRASSGRYWNFSNATTRGLRYPAIRDPQRALGMPEGALVFRYVVETTTNFAGRILPLRFTYTRFEFDGEGNPSPFIGGIGRVLSVTQTPRPEPVFLPNREHTIIDYRLENGRIYSATNLNSSVHHTQPSLEERPAQ